MKKLLRKRDVVLFLCLSLALLSTFTAFAEDFVPVKLVATSLEQGENADAKAALDDDPDTMWELRGPGDEVFVLLDLQQPTVLEHIDLSTFMQSNASCFLAEVEVGANPDQMRPLLGRPINLPSWKGGGSTRVSLPKDTAGRYVRLRFLGGSQHPVYINDLRLIGRSNRPERHLLCWASDIDRDYLSELDYLEQKLGVTDLWLDFVESAFNQSNDNGGFQVWTDSGIFEQLQQRGIRYWLGEHEGFTTLVNSPEDLRDDRRWETTLQRMETIYTQAHELGFRGLVFDAEDYNGVSSETKHRYAEDADYVEGWTFTDEFGFGGYYYQRGLQVGRVIKRVWDCPLIQLYEARMYADSEYAGARDGNYWWLKGIHDAGVEIWIATERTYGAGNQELAHPELSEHLSQWFVNLPGYYAETHEAYPFAKRVLPGFHPWNCRLRIPNYLPEYLDQQLTQAENLTTAYWIYTEGTPYAGNPEKALDPEELTRRNLKPADYIDVFRKHSPRNP